MNTFWGAAISYQQPYTLHPENPPRRLRITQATITSRYDVWKSRSVVQCSVGGRPPVYICALSHNSISLDYEIEESQDVVFSVVGPRGVHLAGYFLPHTQLDDDPTTQPDPIPQQQDTIIDNKTESSAAANEGFIHHDKRIREGFIYQDKRISEGIICHKRIEEGFIFHKRINSPKPSEIHKHINCNHVDKSTGSATSNVSKQPCDPTNDATKDAVPQIDEMVGNEDSHDQIVDVLQEDNLANGIISVSSECQGVVPNPDERDNQTSEFPMPLTIVWPVDTSNPILKNSPLTMNNFVLSYRSVDDRAIMTCSNPSEIGGMVDDLDNVEDMGCNHHVNSTDSISNVSQQQIIAFERADDVRKDEAIAQSDEMDVNEDGYNNTVAVGQNEVSQQQIIAFERADDVRKDEAIAQSDEMDVNEDGYNNTVAVGQNEDVELTNRIISISREYDVIVPDSDDEICANDCHHQFSVPSTILNLIHGWSMKEGRELPKLKFTEETSCDSAIYPTERRSDNHVLDLVMSSIEFGPRDASELKNEKRKKKTEPIGCRKAEASNADQNLSASMTHDQGYDVSMPSIVLEAGCSGQQEKKKSKRNKESKIIGENAGEIQNQVIKSSLVKEMAKLENGKVELGRTTTHDKLQDVSVPSIRIEAKCCEKLEKKKKSKRRHKDLKIIEDNFQENENQDKDNSMGLEYENDRCTAENVIADEHLECSGQQKKKKSKKRNEVSKIIGEHAEEIHNQVTKTSLFKENGKLEDKKVGLDRTTTHAKFQDVFVRSTAIEAGCENMEKRKSKGRHESKIIDDNFQENVNQVKDNGMLLVYEDDRCTNENIIVDEHLKCSDQREKKKSKRRNKGSKIIQENVEEIHNQVFEPSTAFEAGSCDKVEKKRSKRRHKESKIINDHFQENENQDKDNRMRTSDKTVVANEQVSNKLDDNQQVTHSTLKEKRKLKKRKVEECGVHEKSTEIDNNSRNILHSQSTLSESISKRQKNQQLTISSVFEEKESLKEKKVGEGKIHKNSTGNDICFPKIVLALRASSDSNSKSPSQRAVIHSSAPKKSLVEVQRMSKLSVEKDCTFGTTDFETTLESNDDRIVSMDDNNLAKLKKSKSKKSKSRRGETDKSPSS